MQTATNTAGASSVDLGLTTPSDPEVASANAALTALARPRDVSKRHPLTKSGKPGHRLAFSVPPMRDVLDIVERLAATDVTVTVMGETGTGKDVVAHLVHDTSPRANRPFVVFDCGAVPANLMESELFGHERGSFTGAHAEHLGAFERAHGGTLFLDEIGELPLDLQPRLLRVLDNRIVRRVGGTKERSVDVRVIAATNRDLGALTENKQFRSDLYFRLAAAIVRLPPLRERLHDLPALVARLMDDLERPDLSVSDETFDMLRAHSWPGNVRELKNVLACAIAFVDAGVLEPRHLRIIQAPEPNSQLDGLPLGGHTLDNIERIAIKQTVFQTGGNKVRAARALGIAPSTLYEKLRRYGL
jgi:DNA-binding NtrC family response regulator